MKKVLALVLAVMMMATVAFAFSGTVEDKDPKRHVANITPGSSIKVTKDGVKDTGVGPTTLDKDGNQKYTDLPAGTREMKVIVKNELGDSLTTDTAVANGIFRSVTNANYTIQRVRYDKGGKNLITGVTINDKEERVEVKFVDDLDNQTAKSFDVSFTLKGKAKFILRDQKEVAMFNQYCATSKVLKTKGGAVIDEDSNPNDQGVIDAIGKRVTLPDLDFQFIGTVGYGKVEISLGDDNDEEIEDLSDMGVDKENDVVKFKNGGNIGYSKRVAGAFTADAILTEEYGDALLMEARVYAGDVLYFNCDNDPDRDIIGRLADSDADMDFYLFNTNKNYTTFNSNVKLYFNDAEEDDFVYQIKDGKLVKTGEFSEDDDCWIVKTRTLGQYVVSDVELTEFEAAAGDTVDGNPDTGANDVVGIAAALAAVALVSAAAVSLKK